MTEPDLLRARARLGSDSKLWFARLVLIVTGLLTLALAVDLGQGDVLFVFWRRTLLVFAVAGVGVMFLVIAWFTRRTTIATHIEKNFRVPRSLIRLGSFNALGFILSAALMLFLFLGPWRDSFQSLPARFLVLWLTSLLGSRFLYARQTTPRWLDALLFTLIIFAFLYNLTSYLFMLAWTPFSIGWSEATRYYHASLLLSQRFYGLSLPPFYQDLSRYVVEVVPLLLPHPSLILQRIWEYALRFLMPAMTVALILRRLAPARANRAFWWALLLWGTLFLLQGPVYFYLLPAAIPVLAFYHPNKPTQSILALVVASLWAGISRVNWIPIPAMLAIALYLLEVPLAKRTFVRYLLPPVLYTIVGLAWAYAARLWYLDISHVSSAMFNASFIQQLLWYRLFPSSLNAWGILPSGLLMIAPVVIFIFSHLRGRGARWHWIRLLGLGLMLLVLLAGGFIVSAKIGGGNNLHNLDGFSVLFVTVSLYLLFDRFVPDPSTSLRTSDAPASVAPAFVSPLTLTLAILAVIVFTVNQSTPALPSLDRHEQSLASLQSYVDQTVADGGSVLFITQRQLLTYGLITGVPLVPQYDNIDLMEFAMTNYRPLIDQFQADIAAHKYAMIIAPIPPGQLQTTDAAFSEENNAWLKRVSIPLLRSYKVLATFEDGDFVILVPDE
jgi:hypothetical protein